MSLKSKLLIAAIAAGAALDAAVDAARADWIWERRDANQANLFGDLRARKVGDILTIVIDENTGSDAQEKREMEKKTSATGNVNGNGSSSSLGNVLRSFAFDFTLNNSSDRKFDGKANSTINRTFTDRLTVRVIGVEPNGYLVLEGFRTRQIGRETRTLRVCGVARPADIGPFNTLQSQFIGNLQVSYFGRGPETNYTNQGWGGRIFNVLWPN